MWSMGGKVGGWRTEAAEYSVRIIGRGLGLAVAGLGRWPCDLGISTSLILRAVYRARHGTTCIYLGMHKRAVREIFQ